MRIPGSRVRILIMPVLGLLYIAVLIRNLHESDKRSLHLREVNVGDYVSVSIKVVEANLNSSEIRGQICLRPVGSLTKDGTTPARNLKLFLNASHGSQEIEFPTGHPMNPIDAEFSLDGDANRYPFDRHQTTLWFLLTTPSRHERPPTLTLPSISDLAVGTGALEQDSVPISIDLVASIPGVKFSGKISRTQGQDVTGIDLHIKRADNVVAVTIVVMLIMMCLAVSLLAMVLRATAIEGQSTLLPLSLSVSLIFGLPALRNNLEPSVPPVGVFGDYVSFIWAELIVAVSTVVVVWTWIVKSEGRN
jgi:Domain of unknown function (DUF4436)